MRKQQKTLRGYFFAIPYIYKAAVSMISYGAGHQIQTASLSRQCSRLSCGSDFV